MHIFIFQCRRQLYTEQCRAMGAHPDLIKNKHYVPVSNLLIDS